ncbi:MAG: mechanosensitive ion channel family protein [archaeon]|nr:mechanosensitive ion channel family protein [archaeon]
MKFDIGKGIASVVFLAGVVIASRIFGLDPLQLYYFDSAIYVLYTVTLLVIALTAYKFCLVKLLGWLDNSTDDGSTSSVYPILLMFGNMAIILLGLYLTLNHFGVDLLVIVTSLGIVGLAISFGAQSTLQQFFSGIGMILTRSVKTGDVVRVEGNDQRLIVKSIGVMATRFKSMENEEDVTIPNSNLSTALINNLTGESPHYCINVFMDYKVDVVDLDRAYQVLEEATRTVPKVVVDGSLPMPHVHLISYEQGIVKAKLMAYIENYAEHDEIYNQVILTITRALKKEGLLPTGGINIFTEARE